MVKRFKNTVPVFSFLLVFSVFSAHAAPDCQALQSSPIYQVINPTSKANLLTASQSEATNAAKYGFTDNRGIAFYASLTTANELAGAYRMYKAASSDFFWTISTSEVASAVRDYGYTDQGVNFFVSAAPSACTQPVYRYALGLIHRFAITQADQNALTAAGWKNEGIKFYAGVKATPAPEKLISLGINLGAGGIHDWSSERVFADAIKMARPFGSVSAPWNSLNSPAPVDENGWPKGDAGIFVLAVNEGHPAVRPHPSGTYKLYYKGAAKGVAKANGSPLTVTYNSATNEYSADVVYNNNGNLFFTFEGIAGGVKDVRLIRPGDSASDTFDKIFLQRLKAGNDMFGIIRFMEATSTNGSKIAEWRDRTTKSYATQQRQFGGRPAHLAWEYVIELSNQSGKDPWINIPHFASDDYIRNLAVLLKNNLNSDRKIYVEYSNEIWNEAPGDFFAQRREVSKIACDKVVAGDPDQYFWGLNGSKTDCRTLKQGQEYAYLGRHTAWRTKRIGDIFRGVFGDAAMITRVRPILAWDLWSVNKTTPGTLDDQLKYLKQMYGDPSKYVYGVAIGAYVDMQKIAGDNPSEMSLTVNQIFERMTAYNQDFLPGRFSLLRSLANTYGLKMFAYEGGQGLLGATNFNNKLAAQADPRMKTLVKNLLQNWKNAGGDTFIHYGLVSSYANHGFWGLSEQLEDENTPKWQALKEKAAEWKAALGAKANVMAGVVDETTLTTLTGQLEPLDQDIGRTGSVFVFAYMPEAGYAILDPAQTWVPFADCSTAPAVMTGVLQPMNLPVFPDPVDLSAFKGAQVFIGYGLGDNTSPNGSACEEMLSKGRHTQVWTVQ